MSQDTALQNDFTSQAGAINVQVNGEMQSMPEGATCADIITQLGLVNGERFAVERNEEIVPRSHLDTVVLEEGDRIEVIQAIGGG
ncbi:sulfur carrier protein ThiS [Halorhodospira halochloris]|uniref:sulfur carrier protein ThiS n=1 Tax=Halorhodospira halochloris TaxID=1052 RepID=UPI001EE9A538|nr:sulfur carrier protein ThiS [Halorhodospira halochloris]MCG5530305.1 sulfur carrier protein ThiS [Halorhodospira halochloris]